jgi:hypothetical protein
MSDRLENLRVTLRELEAELRSLGTLDDETREQLAAAAEEIAVSLRRGKNRPATGNKTEESLQGRLAEFEATHPQLAGVVMRLLDGLAQLGI